MLQHLLLTALMCGILKHLRCYQCLDMHIVVDCKCVRISWTLMALCVWLIEYLPSAHTSTHTGSHMHLCSRKTKAQSLKLSLKKKYSGSCYSCFVALLNLWMVCLVKDKRCVCARAVFNGGKSDALKALLWPSATVSPVSIATPVQLRLLCCTTLALFW